MNDVTDMDKLEPDDDTVVIGQYAEEAYLSYAISVV